MLSRHYFNKALMMGCQKLVVCSKCKFPFTINEGGGMFFHLLKCDKCGKDRTISFSTLGEAIKVYKRFKRILLYRFDE